MFQGWVVRTVRLAEQKVPSVIAPRPGNGTALRAIDTSISSALKWDNKIFQSKANQWCWVVLLFLPGIVLVLLLGIEIVIGIWS